LHIAKESPTSWTNEVLHEWVRAEFWHTEKNADKAITHLTELSAQLISGDKAKNFNIKSVAGSWDDRSIKKIAARLGCQLCFTDQVKKGINEMIYRDDKNALQYLSARRNAIAHGTSTFEEGAIDMTLLEVHDLSNRVLPFLAEVTNSYKLYLDGKGYIKTEGETA